MKYTIYDIASKLIVKSGSCPLELLKYKVGVGQAALFPIDFIPDDVSQRIDFDGLDTSGNPINPRIIDKPSDELPPTPPAPNPEDMPVVVLKKDWQSVLDRLSALEIQVVTP